MKYTLTTSGETLEELAANLDEMATAIAVTPPRILVPTVEEPTPAIGDPIAEPDVTDMTPLDKLFNRAGYNESLITTGPTHWTLRDDGKIVLNGIEMSESNNVTELMVVAKLSNENETTVRQTAFGLNWTYDLDYTGPGSQSDGWVRETLTDTSAPGPVSDAPTVTETPTTILDPSSEGYRWVPFAPFDHAPNLNTRDFQPDYSKPFIVGNYEQTFYANWGVRAGHVVLPGQTMPVANQTFEEYVEKYHQAKDREGTVTLVCDDNGSSIIQNLGRKSMKDRIGVKAEIGQLREGVVNALLWAYSGWKEGPKYELDFEILGTRGIQINYHDGIRSGMQAGFVPGDFSGRTMTFEIDFDVDAGYAHFIIDGEVVTTITREWAVSNGFRWIDLTMQPIYQLWNINNPAWVGTWEEGGAPVTTGLVERLERV